MFANTPEAPYYAVIFSAQRTAGENSYIDTVMRMVELAAGQPGYLGIEHARGDDGFGITVSYWASIEAMQHWRQDAEHRLAQERGKTEWYEHYEIRIAKVERAYGKAAPKT